MQWLAVLFLGTFLSVSAAGIIAVTMLDRARRDWHGRMIRALGGAEHKVPEDIDAPPRAQSAAQTSGGRFSPSRQVAALRETLAHSGLSLSPIELVAGLVFSGIISFAAAYLLAGLGLLPATLCALAFPPLLAWFTIRVGWSHRQARFTQGFPEALDVFSRSLRSGRPIPDALELMAASAESPLREEFRLCREELRFGASLAQVFRNLAERMPTTEALFFAVAVSLQNETGGNLVETIDNLADQLRERRKLRKKAIALSAEVRLSAVILAALPFALAAILIYLNADYVAPLVTDLRGRVMLGVGLASVLVGLVVMTRMGRLDV